MLVALCSAFINFFSAYVNLICCFLLNTVPRFFTVFSFAFNLFRDSLGRMSYVLFGGRSRNAVFRFGCGINIIGECRETGGPLLRKWRTGICATAPDQIFEK